MLFATGLVFRRLPAIPIFLLSILTSLLCELEPARPCCHQTMRTRSCGMNSRAERDEGAHVIPATPGATVFSYAAGSFFRVQRASAESQSNRLTRPPMFAVCVLTASDSRPDVSWENVGICRVARVNIGRRIGDQMPRRFTIRIKAGRNCANMRFMPANPSGTGVHR